MIRTIYRALCDLPDPMPTRRVTPGLPYLPVVDVDPDSGRVTGLGAARYLHGSMTAQQLAESVTSHVATEAPQQQAALRVGLVFATPLALLINALWLPGMLRTFGLAEQWALGLSVVLIGGLLASLLRLQAVLGDVDKHTGRRQAAAWFVRAVTTEVTDERAMGLFEAYARPLPPAERQRIHQELLAISSDPDRAYLIPGAVDHMRATIETRRQDHARALADTAGRILTRATGTQDAPGSATTAHGPMLTLQTGLVHGDPPREQGHRTPETIR